jgi:hypothetical protein
MAGEHLDVSSDVPLSRPAQAPADAPAGDRSFLGIHFTCCDVYARIHENREGTAYRGHCPRCGRALEVAIGPEGTNERFFAAG